MYRGLQLLLLSSFVLMIHIGSVIAFTHFFSWNLLILSIVLWQILGTIGISVCYHREICHRAFRSKPLVRLMHLTLAMLAGQAGPILWSTVHRTHHKYSDTERDIHSPRDGFFKAHLGWIFQQAKRKEMDEFKNPPQDLIKDPTLVLFQNLFFHVLISQFVLLYFIGGWELYLWLGCFRLMITLNSTWAVNSIGHMFGYRNYETPDRSKNSKLLAFITGGEGFHNNHHKTPSAQNMGHKKGEFDIGYQYIKVLRALGLISLNKSL